MPVKVSTRLLVRSDRLINPFPAGHHFLLLSSPTRDGFRAPSGPQPLLRPALWGHLPRHGGGFPAPGCRLPLDRLMPIAALHAMAHQLPGNQADVPPELISHRPLGSTGGLASRNGRSFRLGQGMVARRHDHSPVHEEEIDYEGTTISPFRHYQTCQGKLHASQ